MLSAMKLLISENGKLIETVSKETSTRPHELIQSLESFQVSVNEALTKLITQDVSDQPDSCLDECEEENSSDEEEENDQGCPRKKRK